MHTETNNADKCIDCPFNPFREDDKDIYGSEDGENMISEDRDDQE